MGINVNQTVSMHAKIKSALNDPRYALYLLRKRFNRSFKQHQIFGFGSDFRSDSENGDYAASVHKALKNQTSFDRFKRNPAYRHILEHVSKAQGQTYLDILKDRNDGLLAHALETVLHSDAVGQPVKFQYDGYTPALSPTTLRYIKVASDLSHLFGHDLEHIAEIGCGYGGQCLVNEKLLGYQFATLFDLPIVNQLIQRYLNYTLMNGAFEVATINEKRPETYDLVISNYAFSELPSALQLVYIDKVLSKAKRGYLTMNSGIGGDHDQGKLSLEALRQALPSFVCLEEAPLTSPHNYIIVWGHDTNHLMQRFKLKNIR